MVKKNSIKVNKMFLLYVLTWGLLTYFVGGFGRHLIIKIWVSNSKYE